MKRLWIAAAIVAFLVGALTFSVTESALADGPSTQDDFVWWQTYCLGSLLEGPAAFYGEDVFVHYTAVNTWTLKKTAVEGGWDINQALRQDGSADIFKLGSKPCNYSWNVEPPGTEGDAIVTSREFHVVETTKGFADTDQDWYHVSHVNELYRYNFHWMIPGIYHFWSFFTDGHLGFKVLRP